LRPDPKGGSSEVKYRRHRYTRNVSMAVDMTNCADKCEDKFVLSDA
jgi:hypothetical protein